MTDTTPAPELVDAIALRNIRDKQRFRNNGKKDEVLTGFLASRQLTHEIGRRILGPVDRRNASLREPFLEGDLGNLGVLELLNFFLGLPGVLGVLGMTRPEGAVNSV